MKKWMNVATAAEQEVLATRAGTTRNYLYQVAGGHRSLAPELAGRIETAARTLRKSKSQKLRLPILVRANLASACAECPYASKCLKGKTDAK